MIDYAKKQGAKRITVDVNKENAASNAIVRKLGFTVVGEKSYKKSGTDMAFTDYQYEMKL